MARGVLLYSQYTPHTTCTKRFLSLILRHLCLSLLWMVDIGKRVCLYAFTHVLMRVRSSMMLSSTCAWLRLAGGVLVSGPGAAGRDSRSPPPPPATLYLTLSRSRSLSLSVRPRVRRWRARSECRLDLIDIIKSFYSGEGLNIYSEILKGLMKWKVYSKTFRHFPHCAYWALINICVKPLIVA